MSDLFVLAFAVLVGLALFVLLRKAVLAYWRINELHETLGEIRDELRRLNAAPRTPPTPPKATP